MAQLTIKIGTFGHFHFYQVILVLLKEKNTHNNKLKYEKDNFFMPDNNYFYR